MLSMKIDTDLLPVILVNAISATIPAVTSSKDNSITVLKNDVLRVMPSEADNSNLATK